MFLISSEKGVMCMASDKKVWTAPRLKHYGDIAQITLNSNAANRDTPSGVANTAFPNVS
jgi:hypothetical protein